MSYQDPGQQPYPEYPAQQPNQPNPGYPAQQPYPGYPAQPQNPGYPQPQDAGYSAGYPGQQPNPGYPAGYPAQPQNPGYPQQDPGYPAGYPAQPWQQIPATPDPPRKSRTGLYIGAGVVVGLAAIGVAYAATSGGSNKPAAQSAPTTSASPSASSSPTDSASAQPTQTGSGGSSVSVVVPDSAGGLTKMTGSSADAVTQAMAKADAGNSALSGAKFAAYEKTGTSTYFGDFTLVPLSSSTELKDLESTEGASATLKAIVEGGLSNTASEPAAVPNGAMACGLIKGSSLQLRACAWIDDSEYALTAFSGSISNAEAAQYSAALWQASEKG
jgi:hypothetical protein